MGEIRELVAHRKFSVKALAAKAGLIPNCTAKYRVELECNNDDTLTFNVYKIKEAKSYVVKPFDSEMVVARFRSYMDATRFIDSFNSFVASQYEIHPSTKEI